MGVSTTLHFRYPARHISKRHRKAKPRQPGPYYAGDYGSWVVSGRANDLILKKPDISGHSLLIMHRYAASCTASAGDNEVPGDSTVGCTVSPITTLTRNDANHRLLIIIIRMIDCHTAGAGFAITCIWRVCRSSPAGQDAELLLSLLHWVRGNVFSRGLLLMVIPHPRCIAAGNSYSGTLRRK